jgi:dTDP-4-dehydrorhamnose reductase
LRQPLLIIGATGFVGSRWAHHAKERFEVIKGARSAPDRDDSVSIDITDPASVAHAFDRARPDLVTHLAALSDIDRCEREPELADRINYHGAIHVADECARRGARMFYTSTDAVFDGSRGMYHEYDEPTPPNWYGHTKARAERAILERLSSAVVIRLSLVLGRGLEAAGNSYLEKVAGNLAAKNPIVTPTYEVRNPIDVGTACRFFEELALRPDASGIFHIGASDKMSRYELARAIATRLGYDPGLIVEQTAPVAGRAPRGRDDFLVTERIRQFCATKVPTCREVIERACDATA